ncbi:hypothetical protein MFRU_012g00680 [Monilinia fructicola]|nr:hypothetical protein MFRU_012g00680 [Monilinia fructicola]
MTSDKAAVELRVKSAPLSVRVPHDTSEINRDGILKDKGTTRCVLRSPCMLLALFLNGIPMLQYTFGLYNLLSVTPSPVSTSSGIASPLRPMMSMTSLPDKIVFTMKDLKLEFSVVFLLEQETIGDLNPEPTRYTA